MLVELSAKASRRLAEMFNCIALVLCMDCMHATQYSEYNGGLD